MTKPTLIIGNKNYSSWSLRPWLGMKAAGIDFEEKLILLFDENWKDNIAAASPTKRVPVLVDGDLVIPESLAILEYMADKHPDKGLWPADIKARATARAAACEMHAGFTALRNHMPMNIRRETPGKGMGPGVAEDVARIEQLWGECRAKYGKDGDFLFGHFTITDAMFAPVVWRLTNFAVAVNPVSAAYMEAMRTHPAMIEWADAGRAEPWTVPEDEI